MAFLGTLTLALASLIDMLLQFYVFIILGVVIISWVNPDPYNPIVRFLRLSTEPVFKRIRRLLPRALFTTGIDFTPMIAMVLLWFIKFILVQTLTDMGMGLRR